MAYPLIPPKSQWVDANGDPLVGGYLKFQDPGTDALKATYPTAGAADSASFPNTNPVVLDSRGEAAIFLRDGETYKVTLYDANDVQLWQQDDVACPPAQTAAAVTITDAGGYYASSTVEAALQELGASTGAGIIGIADGGGYYSGTDVESALQALGGTGGAAIIGIADAGGYFTATDVEGALQEMWTSTDGSFTATYNGFASATGGWHWQRTGHLVTMTNDASLSATSTATTFSSQLGDVPAAIRPTRQQGAPFSVQDNGTFAWGMIEVTTGGTINFYTGPAQTGASVWTASGSKGYRSGQTFTYALY